MATLLPPQPDPVPEKTPEEKDAAEKDAAKAAEQAAIDQRILYLIKRSVVITEVNKDGEVTTEARPSMAVRAGRKAIAGTTTLSLVGLIASAFLEILARAYLGHGGPWSSLINVAQNLFAK